MKRAKPSVKVQDASDSSDGEDADAKEVQVDFELYNPSEIDFLSVKNLSRAMLANISGDLSLASTISQAILDGDVGSVVKSEGYTDALAVISVLPLWGEKSEAWAKVFLDSVGIAKKDAVGVGLLVNLRIINMPVMKLAPAMHKCLFDEVAKQRTGDNKYTRYIMVNPYYLSNELDEANEEGEKKGDDDDDDEKKDEEEEEAEDKAAKRKTKKAAKKKAKMEESVKAAAAEAQAVLDAEKIYVRAEEELYVDAADKVVEVKPSPLSSSADAHSLLVPKHTQVIIVSAAKIPAILKRMNMEFQG